MTGRGESRGLGFGEIALATSMFGSEIDVTRVRIHRRRWWRLQPRRVVMAPDGDIWFHPDSPDWSEDFAREDLATRAFFIHEMTHVWQHQQGVNLLLRRMPWARYRYLPLTPGKPFRSYGVEQQAEIVRHAYVLREGGRVIGAPGLEVYETLIVPLSLEGRGRGPAKPGG